MVQRTYGCSSPSKLARRPVSFVSTVPSISMASPLAFQQSPPLAALYAGIEYNSQQRRAGIPPKPGVAGGRAGIKRCRARGDIRPFGPLASASALGYHAAGGALLRAVESGGAAPAQPYRFGCIFCTRI